LRTVMRARPEDSSHASILPHPMTPHLQMPFANAICKCHLLFATLLDQTPPVILFNFFKTLEPSTKDPGEFMDAAIEYVEYTRDANDLAALAISSKRQGAAQPITVDYLDRMMEAVRGSGKALDRMVPLLPD